ncbi:MAG: energy transducer TonB [Lentimicrobiaceae bacterium]|nr:energy transducer TonB [Lentimicrobiaceae bacterium]
MSENPDKIKGLAGTLIFHALFLVAMLLMALKTPLPLPGEEGVEVDLGYSDQGMGLIQPEETASPDEVLTQPAPPEPQPEEEVLTQDVEETPVSKPKTERPREQAEPVTDQLQKESIDQRPPEPEQVVNPSALYKGPSKEASASGNQGITGAAGDQGRPDGVKGANNYDGMGGSGGGVSYSLSGRKANSLPKPDYPSDEQGRVVVTIWVDRAGKVTKAEAGAKGTTIADLTLRTQARNAALRATFSASSEAPELQTGTITYIFIKMN